MVLLGGLEVLAAGYLIHKHSQNKKERARLEEEAAALEEASYPLFPADQRPPRRHTHSASQSQSCLVSSSSSRPHSHGKYDKESESEEERRERRERRRRRKEKREEEEKLRKGRTNSAPPGMGMGPNVSTQTLVAPGVVAGWPAHWKQSQVPPVQPPRPHPQQAPPQAQAYSRHQAQRPVGGNGYPQDVKYGFDPDIPHDAYPSYPPPPFEEAVGESREERRRRRREERHREREERGREGDRLEVRGRRERRSVSPMLGVYDEDSRSPGPRVRFSNEDVVLGGSNPPPKYRS